MKNSIIFAAATLGLAVAGQAQAKDLDREKFEQRAEKQFGEADLDGSGMLENSDIVAMLEGMEQRRAERRGEDARPVRERRVERWLDGKDTNGDGMLSKDEFVAMRLANFEEKDSDNDGVLDDSERNS